MIARPRKLRCLIGLPLLVLIITAAAVGEVAPADALTPAPPPAQTPALEPAPPGEPAAQVSDPIRRSEGPINSGRRRGDGETGGQTGPASAMGFAQVALALTGVVTLILLLRWAAMRVMPGMAAPGASRAMQVLARGAIGPRQQVIVLKVGRRIIVAGSSGGQLSTLCEITDPQESAELIGQIEAEKGESITRAFASMFSREREKFEDEDGLAAEDRQPAPDPAVEQVRDELGGLMEKVRMVSRQFRG